MQSVAGNGHPDAVYLIKSSSRRPFLFRGIVALSLPPSFRLIAHDVAPADGLSSRIAYRNPKYITKNQASSSDGTEAGFELETRDPNTTASGKSIDTKSSSLRLAEYRSGNPNPSRACSWKRFDTIYIILPTTYLSCLRPSYRVPISTHARRLCSIWPLPSTATSTSCLQARALLA